MKRLLLGCFFVLFAFLLSAQDKPDSLSIRKRSSYFSLMGFDKYVFEGKNSLDFDLSEKKVTETDLDSVLDNNLAFIRNEIYARHGYRFRKEIYREYFENKDWYEPAENNSRIRLNETEKYNAAFIRQVEEKRRRRREAIVSYFRKEKLRVENEEKALFRYLDNIEMDSIVFRGNDGLYQKIVYVGEGDVLERKYSMRITEKEILVSCITVIFYPSKWNENEIMMSPRGNEYIYNIDSHYRITKSPIMNYIH